MCNDHAFSRRRFLRSAGVLAASATLAARAPRALASQRTGNQLQHPLAVRPMDPWGNPAWSNAMHIHSSFSEYTGSMDSHLHQATLNAVDVLWWTDHNERLDGTDYWQVIHFTSLDGEKPPPGAGRKPLLWERRESGPNSSVSTGGIVTTPCSPNDPVTGGAMSLTAQSTSRKPASYGFLAGSEDYRDNLGRQSLSIDVMLEPGWSRGYLELDIATSYHPAFAGPCTLSYRLVPSGSAHRTLSGNTGIVVIPVTADGQTWTTVTVTPQDDIAALWPGLDARDFALYELSLSAVSTGDTVRGYFDYLQFNRILDGGGLFAQQAGMMGTLAEEYPAVTQQQGLEVGFGLPHINWFGPNIQPFTYAGLTMKQYPAWVESEGIPAIHQAGGLACWNHPFGTDWSTKVKPQSVQNTLLQQVAAQLLPAAVHGCDIMEVGYPERNGVDLAHHVALWDILSRNAVFVTGNGTSDDHWGTDWAGLTWNWVTSTWAASRQQSDLLTALSAGRVYCGSLAAPPVALDLLVDGQVPMGAVSVSSLNSRSLAVTASGLPSGYSVQVLQGAVDYAGTSRLQSNAVQVGSFGSTDLNSNGQATLNLDASAGCFVRTQVVDSSGTVRALSNPVWLLNAEPPNGIPAPREA